MTRTSVINSPMFPPSLECPSLINNIIMDYFLSKENSSDVSAAERILAIFREACCAVLREDRKFEFLKLKLINSKTYENFFFQIKTDYLVKYLIINFIIKILFNT